MNSNALVKSMETSLSLKDTPKIKHKKKTRDSLTEDTETDDNSKEKVTQKPNMEEIPSVNTNTHHTGAIPKIRKKPKRHKKQN